MTTSSENITLKALDQHDIPVQRWIPDDSTHNKIVGVVQIAHGMGEHILRYEWVAEQLNAAGFAVVGNDHRGHGKAIGDDQAGSLPGSPPASLPGSMGADGWTRTLLDMRTVNQFIRRSYPGKPVIMLGHSMGAMLTQQYLPRWGHSLDAAVLSGSPGFSEPFQLQAIRLLAGLEKMRLGAHSASDLLQQVVFGRANNRFDDETLTGEATGFEWLSRDSAAVRAYVADPQCGFVLSAGSLAQMFAGVRESSQTWNTRCIPPSLPIYIFSGAQDPVHEEEANLNRLLENYRAAQLNIHYKLYPNGRHEMFNENNKEEVLADLVSWLRAELNLPT